MKTGFFELNIPGPALRSPHCIARYGREPFRCHLPEERGPFLYTEAGNDLRENDLREPPRFDRAAN